MRTITFCLISLALIGAAFGTGTTVTSAVSPSTGAFSNAPVQVLDGVGNTTDAAIWGTMATGGVNVATIMFGPGTDNTTVYIWGAKLDSTGATLTGFVSRKISASQILNGTTGNTAKEESVLTVGDAGSQTATLAILGNYKIAVGPATYGFATVVEQGTTSYNVMLYVVSTGGSVKSNTVVAGPTTVADASTGAGTGTKTMYAVDAIYQEDGVYYVLYETQTYTQGGTTGAYTQTYALAGLYIQGVFATNGSAVFTTPLTVTTSFGAATTAQVVTGTIGMQSFLQPAGLAGSNFTNSTMLLVGFTEIASVGTRVGTITRALGSTATLNTFVAPAETGASTSSQVITTIGLAGVWTSNATYGFTISNSTATGSSNPTYTYGAVGAFNGSASGSTTGLSTSAGGLTFSGAVSTPSVTGYRYSTGLFAVSAVETTTASPMTMSYTGQFYYPNITTTNGSNVALGTYDGSSIQPQYFVDVNGTAWVGYATTSVYTPSGGTAQQTNIGTAYIGRIYSDVNIYYPAAGSVLSTIAALLSFVIASIFIF